MATSDYWSEADIKALTGGGLVNEDVMQRIWDITDHPLVFTDMVGEESAENGFHEWTIDELAAVDLTNAVADGADSTSNDAKGGSRVGNHHQISEKSVQVSERAQEINVIGRRNELMYQTERRLKELKRDVEAIVLFPQASLKGDGASVAGKVGSLPSWLETNVSFGANNGAAGGFNTSTKIVDIVVAGDARVLSKTLIDLQLKNAYIEGGDPSVLMSTPPMIAGLASYLITSSKVAALRSVEGDGGKRGVTSAVNVYTGQFNTITLLANREQQPYDSGDASAEDVVDVFLLEPALLKMTYIYKPRMKPLAKAGLADKRQISTDWSLMVNNEKAQGNIRDCQAAGTVID